MLGRRGNSGTHGASLDAVGLAFEALALRGACLPCSEAFQEPGPEQYKTLGLQR